MQEAVDLKELNEPRDRSGNPGVIRGQNVHDRDQQRGRVKRVGVVMLAERANMPTPAARHDFSKDALSLRLPFTKKGAVLPGCLGDLQSTVERYEAHHLAGEKMAL